MGVTAFTAAVGLYSAVSADDHADEQVRIQKNAEARKAELQAEELDFKRQQYERWEGIYGKVEENLGHYYNNLDSESYKVQALQQEKEQLQHTQEAIKKQFAGANLGSNAAEQLALAGSTINSAQNRSEIELTAEDVIAQKQLGFVQSGRGQQSNAVSGMSSANNNAMNSANNTAINAGNLNRSYQQDRNRAVGGLLDIGLDVAKSYNPSPSQPQTLEELWGSLGG